MGRLRTIIQTSSDAITGKTTLMLKTLIASAALAVGLTSPQIPHATEAPEIQPLPVIPYEASWICLVVFALRRDLHKVCYATFPRIVQVNILHQIHFQGT